MAAFIKKVGSLQAHFDITRIDKNNLLSCCCILDFGSPKQINGQQRKPRNRLMEDHSNFNPVNVKHTGALCLSVSIFFLQKWSSVIFFFFSYINRAVKTETHMQDTSERGSKHNSRC